MSERMSYSPCFPGRRGSAELFFNSAAVLGFVIDEKPQIY